MMKPSILFLHNEPSRFNLFEELFSFLITNICGSCAAANPTLKP
jgi:hypothetical protein